MYFPQELVPGRFLKRNSRFSAHVLIEGKNIYVHVPNSGRLRELLTPNREVLLLPKDPETERKTSHTLLLARYGNCYVGLHAGMVNDLFEEAMSKGVITELKDFRILAREKPLGMGRIDFLLENRENRKMFVELKSVSLVVEKRAFFPDAPTERGIRHLKELTETLKEGNLAGVVFIITRTDADSVSPNDAEVPEFGQTLRTAFKNGVKILAYKCKVTPAYMEILCPIPIIL